MIIQNNISNLAAATTNQSMIERQSFAAPQDKIAANPEKTADSITLSQEARNRLASDQSPSMYPPSTMSALAHSDPKLAEQLVHTYTFGLDSGLVDISNMDPGTGTGARYVATGEAVPPESERWFNQEGNRIRQERIALYQSEKAKGTPDAVIFDKILSHMDSQPPRYLQMMDWDVVSGRQAAA